MSRDQIFNKIQLIFRDVLENDSIIIEESFSANDIDEWDSLSHILLITEIEKQFNTKFLSYEIISWKNIGEMIDCIENKK